jgi:hypothetical protein
MRIGLIQHDVSGVSVLRMALRERLINPFWFCLVGEKEEAGPHLGLVMRGAPGNAKPNRPDPGCPGKGKILVVEKP